ncbi:hypothetical protein MAIT1_00795 [Magnetofaba australis IT-1]|uniref:Uncharacterized protein n=1 Tax=Magnetofaba australis IT-1 TaxID=1434232 RepID=A0A1Y2JZH5_9PROT|nr:hypothetical protein MAIT1_00795 [Magnetofaba australis IT-1]
MGRRRGGCNRFIGRRNRILTLRTLAGDALRDWGFAPDPDQGVALDPRGRRPRPARALPVTRQGNDFPGPSLVFALRTHVS